MAQDPAVLRLINQLEDKPDVFCSKMRGLLMHAGLCRPRWDLSGRRGQVTFWGGWGWEQHTVPQRPCRPAKSPEFLQEWGVCEQTQQRPTKGQNSSSAFVLNTQNG